MRSTAYHQANIVATQFLEEIKNVKDTILQEINSHEENKETEYKANIATSNPVQIEILKLIKTIQQDTQLPQQQQQHE